MFAAKQRLGLSALLVRQLLALTRRGRVYIRQGRAVPQQRPSHHVLELDLPGPLLVAAGLDLREGARDREESRAAKARPRANGEMHQAVADGDLSAVAEHVRV